MENRDKIIKLENIKAGFLLRADKAKASPEDKIKFLADIDQKIAELKGE